MTLHAIVPAGGAGTRLWPLSRRDHPKFLHDLTGAGRSLLQATIDRMTPLTTSITVVTGARHARAVRAQLSELPADAVLAEPAPRDSMAAIGLAAQVLARRHPGQEVIVGSFAADHLIDDVGAFAAAVETAVASARAGDIATIGIEASEPSTAFGYIEAGRSLPVDGPLPVHRVESFTEKPDAATAADYLRTGRYRWNAGMFVADATVLLGHLATEQPDLAAGLERIGAAWDTAEQAQVLAEVWPTLPAISIDHAIAEPVAARGGVAVVPAAFGWDDVGDWAALRWQIKAGSQIRVADDGVAADRGSGTDAVAGDGAVAGDAVADDGAAAGPQPGPPGPAVLGDAAQVLAIDAPGGLVVPTSGRRVVLIGVPDAVVIDTPDALLVTTTDRAQQVKDAVAELQRAGETDLL